MATLELRAEKIEATIAQLEKRIDERFPGRGLSRVCAELHAIAKTDREKMRWRKRPNLWIRASVALIIMAGLAGTVWAIYIIRNFRIDAETFSALEGAEAIFNIVALVGAAIWFLLNLENVWRREAILGDLHELRSIAHVVDMHQLTKDPTRSATGHEDTASSPKNRLTQYELERYLDYCSEMLALTGKLAALYMQDTRDPVVIQTVDEIENLTTNLSRKIWQKIVMLRPASSGLAN